MKIASIYNVFKLGQSIKIDSNWYKPQGYKQQDIPVDV